MRERSLVEGIKKERERERERCRESEDVRMTVRQTERELTNGREGRDIERESNEKVERDMLKIATEKPLPYENSSSRA